MADLELIHLAEIHDEHDDRVEELEGAVRDLQLWRQEVDGNLDDVRYELRCITKFPTMQPQQPPLPMHQELAITAYSDGPTVDWPDGHRIASISRERAMDR